MTQTASREALPELGHRLHAARRRRGLSQGTAARLAKIAPSYLSRIETGKIQPTFPTVLRILRALHIDLEEVAGPSPEHTRGPCPVSAGGRCLLDLFGPESEAPGSSPGEHYTSRQIRLLRSLATWLRSASPERTRAMEILVADLTRASASERESS